MPSRPGPAATRRAALGGVLAGVAGVAACDLDPPDPTPRPDLPDETGADPDTDPGILEAARTELDELLTLLAAATAARPGRSDALADLVALHQAHRDALQGEMATLAPPSLPDTANGVRAVIDRRQRRLQRRLTGWALDARSGTLARLLASMSAAIAQQTAASYSAGGPPGQSP